MKVLIVGQGIAGTLLARELKARAVEVCLVDRPAPTAASRMAAGLVNPIVGKRHVLSWEVERLLPLALSIWRDIESETGLHLVYEFPFTFFFRDGEDRTHFYGRSPDAVRDRFIGPQHGPEYLGNYVRNPFGSFDVRGVFRVDLKAFVDCYRERWLNDGSLIEAEFVPTLDGKALSGRPTWRGQEYDLIVYSQGFELAKNPHFDWLDYRLSQGEILDLVFDDELPYQGLHFGRWLLPFGKTQARFGSNYEHTDYDRGPTEIGRQELEATLIEKWQGSYRVVGHQAGARAGTNDSKPYIGRSPDNHHHAAFGGFGSKGTMTAPGLARNFARHLVEDEPLMPAADLTRRLKFRGRSR